MRFPSSPRLMRFCAVLLFLFFGGVVESFYLAGHYWLLTERRYQVLSHGAVVRARIESEINSVLFLNSGLASYLTAKHDALDPAEVKAILGNLYQQSRHVRNFGIAVGFRLTYVYPEEGNQAAIGMDYRSEAEQWPLIEYSVAQRQAMLAGPLRLKQGGLGIIYRTPIYIADRYWGLISTVIDHVSIFQAARLMDKDDGYAYALRGKDGMGSQGATFLGEAELFDDSSATIMEVLVPGGHWLLAVKPVRVDQQFDHWLLVGRLAGWFFSALFAYVALAWLKLHRRMADLALFDTLTGLPNRNLLMDRFTQMLYQAGRENSPFSLLYIDLDGFKAINDSLGHKVGDLVLLEVATRLDGALRRSDTVTRWGGDEFVVLLSNTGRDGATRLAENLRAAVDAPIAINDRAVKVGASIGVAVYPDDGDNVSALMRVADLRMYREKGQRKSAAGA